MKTTHLLLVIFSVLYTGVVHAQNKASVSAITASTNEQKAFSVSDDNPATGWNVDKNSLLTDQFIMLTLNSSADINEIQIASSDLSKKEMEKLADIYITYDPMNLGEPVKYAVSGDKSYSLKFAPKYGAHVKIVLKGKALTHPYAINDIRIYNVERQQASEDADIQKPWLNTSLTVDERVELILAVMKPEEKMELIREGWGIPGVKRLGIPAITKVEAIHGYSYGKGATVFPQSIGLGATWNKTLMETVATAIGKETADAGTLQAWSPVLDVAQDPRWGRCEETYGEDPVLVSLMGGAWIKGFQSVGLWTTPKHFGIHGAPLGGRDSHDIGLSEREMREVHLVPFRDVIKKYGCQSIMMSYNDFKGVPVAKSKELLNNILREEWGFNGFIVSDCGAIGNLTAKKHYTAKDHIEAAEQALAAGIATNCGNTYNNADVITAAKEGKLNAENLDNVCRTMLRTMFRNNLFENNPSKSLDWDKVYPGWNTPEHRELARKAARESIVLLENKNHILPLSKSTQTIAVIGPGADDLQTGDYTQKLFEDQLKSVLYGIKDAVGKQTKVIYEKGCAFFKTDSVDVEAALKAANKSDVVIMVLGDCSTSESGKDIVHTSGENNDYATLELPGYQQKLLEAVCATQKPVILVLQAGRPFNLSYAAEHCQAILVNWLPGQEGGPATADVLFGNYNPSGRLPMTFPRHVGQVPFYYNFKTSGRRYEYVDIEFKPLYAFGYGLSYTSFEYSNLKTEQQADGNIRIQATVKNTGTRAGDEVVQLYITDMYASVKTRIMELKNFEKIYLEPNESKTVSFTLTPYEISLLNDSMDRTVEPGEYKIMVGGKSPSYKPNDRIKDSVGFTEAADGVNGAINYTQSYKALFELAYKGMSDNLMYNKRKIQVAVKNTGNITDTGRINMYINGEKQDDTHHFEIDPGQSQIITFDVSNTIDINKVVFTTKYKSLEKIFD
ncbi:MAG: glycoside hydrolase family 3 C-terminal domain-containing protein [Dysgonamonadaceae bacterium]|jgi:beta-glucosidase|nr:glycoside hydrolase family 3 C-terminal domain-containing protein [Dysgonamonadaceae bacterium]